MANELHKPVRYKFLKRFVFVRNVDDVWGADLVDMQKMAKKKFWLSIYPNDYRCLQ